VLTHQGRTIEIRGLGSWWPKQVGAVALSILNQNKQGMPTLMMRLQRVVTTRPPATIQ